MLVLRNIKEGRIGRVFNYKHVLFFVVVSCQMLVYNYPYILQIEPRNHHAFRQYDCLSFAQAFYNNRATLLEPCVNNLGNAGNGKTASEFPLVQFLVGNIWKVSGISSLIYRLVNVLFLYLGLFFIYKLFYLEFKNKLFATFVSSLIFTSPILSYYGVSVISDIQALSLSLAGFYFFYRWYKYKRTVEFVLFAFLFLVAGLLKISSSALYLVCMSSFIISALKESKDGIVMFSRKNRWQWVVLFLVFVIWAAWYLYARNYNKNNNQDFFLVGILPIWDLTPAALIATTRSFVYNTLPAFFSPSLLFFIFISICVSAFFYWKNKEAKALIPMMCFIFFLGFVLLFFKALDIHDYYLINMLGLLTVAIFIMCKISQQQLFNHFDKTILVLILLVAINTYTSGVKTWKKINFNVQSIENAIVFNESEQKNFFWMYWVSRNQYAGIEKKNLNLDKLGISKSDTLLCLGDGTINASLFLLNRVGYTDYNHPFENPAHFIAGHKNIKCVVVIKSKYKSNSNLIPLFHSKIYEKDSLSIYKLK